MAGTRAMTRTRNPTENTSETMKTITVVVSIFTPVMSYWPSSFECRINRREAEIPLKNKTIISSKNH